MMRPRRRHGRLAILALIAASACGGTAPLSNPGEGSGSPSPAGDAAAGAESDLGLGLAVVDVNGLVHAEASGLRRMGSPEQVTVDDQWHLGSDTKAMTATLAAILVEEGLLAWDSSPADVLGLDPQTVDPALAGITLEQLLTHTSGITPDLPVTHPAVWSRMQAETDAEVVQTRRWVASQLLAGPASYPPGTDYGYSNGGYVIAGAMLEQVTGTSWEELMQERLFGPLDMTCGFGPPEGDAPLGHLSVGATLVPVSPGPGSDNPVSIGPAGTVRCDLASWAQFVALHLRGTTGDTALLPQDAFVRLHTPTAANPEYAYGWGVRTNGSSPDWADGRLLLHAGSNGRWYALAWLALDKGRAYLATTNVGDPAGLEEALMELVEEDS